MPIDYALAVPPYVSQSGATQTLFNLPWAIRHLPGLHSYGNVDGILRPSFWIPSWGQDELSQFADAIVAAQLDRLSVASIAIVLMAGLLTSLTPCMLSMLPITIAYIGGYEGEEKSDRWQGAIQSTWFALGLASTLAILGIAAASLGKVYGQIGIGLPIFVSLIAILMGLNLRPLPCHCIPKMQP